MNTPRRTRRRAPETPLSRMAAWTTILALVFSAGLITGQRLWTRQAGKPLIAVSASGTSEIKANARSAKADPKKKGAKENPVDFSFYEELAPEKNDPEVAEKVGEKADSPLKLAGSAPQKLLSAAVSSAVSTRRENGDRTTLPARYTLQVGSHEGLARARRQIKRLKARGLEPHLTVVQLPDHGKRYRVRVGKFHSLKEARHFQSELRRLQSMRSFVSPI